jgi:hypothetical protein
MIIAVAMIIAHNLNVLLVVNIVNLLAIVYTVNSLKVVRDSESNPSD